MKNIKVLFASLCAAAMLVAGCASSSPSSSDAQFGVIKSINPTTETQSGINAGTVIGGVRGGLADHQIGSGRGNTAATVGGAVIGAQVGIRIASQTYKIGVRLQDGTFETVNQKGSVADLRVDQRVKVEDGEVQTV